MEIITRTANTTYGSLEIRLDNGIYKVITFNRFGDKKAESRYTDSKKAAAAFNRKKRADR